MPFQVIPHFLCWHRPKWIHRERIKGVETIRHAAPLVAFLVVSLSRYFLFIIGFFVCIGLIASALVTCVRCLREPTGVKKRLST